MTLQDETGSIAAPGFAGFVPSMKYQFGLTYGNATRHILRTDPSLKKGVIQQDLAKRIRAYKAGAASKAQQSAANETATDDDAYVWKGRNKYATGDDRFSFPPVPGYTGYIPRSQEHFGRPYVETTNASLANFQRMLKSKNALPPRVLAIQQKQMESIGKPHTAPAAIQPVGGSRHIIDDLSPYQLPKGHPSKTFISGYTGFVPRLQNHFGEPYSDSVRSAIDEFTLPPAKPTPPKDAKSFVAYHPRDITRTDPIPGFTGFIPGSRTCYSTTFGKTSEIAYGQFNHRDQKGRVPQQGSAFPSKVLSASLPIPGYRGHIPGFAFSAERSYGISSKECISAFDKFRKEESGVRSHTA